MRAHARCGLVVSFLAASVLLTGCKKANQYVAPAPAEVGVANPVQKDVPLYLDLTGNTVAIDQVNLVARVPGFLQQIDYKDGAYVKKGTTLFVIEPPPYEAKYQQATAALSGAKAELVQAQAEFSRQSQLASQNFASQSKLDLARAKRDSDQAAVKNDEASLALSAINLSYTRVNAPFDGIVTQHLESQGALVGESGPTKLATIVSIAPIYVTFNIAESDVLRIRAELKARGVTLADLGAIPVEVGLANETGYPHQGVLDYVAPEINPSTGTLLARAEFANTDRALLPGYFVRVRVPEGKLKDATLIPDTAWQTDQQGTYVLVLGPQDKVEQRRVALGPEDGTLRVVSKGLSAADKVIVSGAARAIPGQIVAPKTVTLALSTAAAP